MKGYFRVYCLIAFVSMVVLFISCKKDKSDSLSSNNVSVSLDPIKVVSFDTKTDKFEYAFTGKIIAPRKVKLNEYGFIISPVGVSSYSVIMGPTELVGSISINRSSYIPITEGNVVFYIELENGEIIRSDGQTNAAAPDALTATVQNQTWTGLGSVQRFEGNLNNPSQFYWGIYEYGVEYMSNGNYPGGPPQRYTVATSLDYHIENLPFKIDVGGMLIDTTYWYRPYFEMRYFPKSAVVYGQYKKFKAQ